MNELEFKKQLRKIKLTKRSAVLSTKIIKDKTKYTRKLKHKGKNK